MDYKSFEYMRKTLPNEFNWSILYQLFSEDEIELSETAENYLRTTPWNTNLTIFEEILEAGEGGQSDKATLYLDGNYFDETDFEKHIDKSRSTITSLNDLWTWCVEHNTRTYKERKEASKTVYDINFIANDIEVYVAKFEYGTLIGYSLLSGPTLLEYGKETPDCAIDENWMWSFDDGFPSGGEYFYFTKTTATYNYDN